MCREITLKVAKHHRTAAAGVYAKYRETFPTQVKGAQSKELLIRDEDVQVLHRFDGQADQAGSGELVSTQEGPHANTHASPLDLSLSQ